MSDDAPLDDLRPTALLAEAERQLRRMQEAAQASQAQLEATRASIADARTLTAANDARVPPSAPPGVAVPAPPSLDPSE